MPFFTTLQTRLIGAALLAVALAISHLVAYTKGKHSERTKWELATAKQKTEAAQQLAKATAKTAETERRQSERKTYLEQDHEKTKNDLSRLYAEYRTLRLRDPGRGQGSGSALPCPAGGTNASENGEATAEGLLSEQAQDRLWSLAAEADRILEIARTCQSSYP